MHFLAFTGFCFGALAYARVLERQQQTVTWQPCPELNRNISVLTQTDAIFDCATLAVPLDYADPNSQVLQLSLFKVNATRQPAAGSVLVNFGGPGGTGAENLPVWASQIAANVGEQWDLISWDPRGTGKTIPFDCGISPTASAPSLTNNRKRDTDALPSANLTDYFLNFGWDNAEFIAESCFDAMNATGRYIGTTATARDMISIVDALDEDGLLRYYGWSYGTALGSYVAAIFPERVDRIVLDANIDPHNYQAGHYGNFLEDADKAFEAFLQECLNHRDSCPLALYTNATTSSTMLDAINRILQPLATNATTSVEAWTIYSAALGLVFQPLYYPSQWPQTAELITSVVNGTFDLVSLLTSAASTTTTNTPTTNSSVEPYNLGSLWATQGIRASDALWRTDSAQEYLPQVLYQESVSSFDLQYPGLWASARWRMDAVERYDGNFSVKTKHPILYVNGEYDPVTPLSNAYNGSKGFEGSVVLPHSGYGHGVFVSPSTCVAGYIRAYFANGTLPESDAHCEREFIPWETISSSTPNNSSGSDSYNTSTPGGSNSTTTPTSPPPGQSSPTISPPYTGSANHMQISISSVFASASIILFSVMI